MNCPVDSTALVMSDRQGIEIDYCPKCRGVWLDRGELDKIVERSASFDSEQPSAPAPQHDSRRDSNDNHGDRDYRRDDDHNYRRDDHRDYRDDRRGYSDHGPKKHKREGFLGDLFDFGD